MFLLLVDLEAVHFVFAFSIRVEIILAGFVFGADAGCPELGFGQILVESFVLTAFFGDLSELELEDEELFDLLVRDRRQDLSVRSQGNHGQQKDKLVEDKTRLAGLRLAVRVRIVVTIVDLGEAVSFIHVIVLFVGHR